MLSSLLVCMVQKAPVHITPTVLDSRWHGTYAVGHGTAGMSQVDEPPTAYLGVVQL